MENWLTLALGEVFVLFDGIFAGLTDSPYFAILLVSSVIMIAFSLIKKAKKASR